MHIRVYYEDTDCGGVVYYANFLKYFERARTHYLEERGLIVAELLKQGIEFRVTHAEVRYRSAALYGETLNIETSLTRNRRSAVTFSHLIHELTTNRLVVEGSATLITVDLEGKVKRLEPTLLKALGILAGRE